MITFALHTTTTSWSGNYFAPTFYDILGIYKPKRGESHDLVLARVIAAWQRFKRRNNQLVTFGGGSSGAVFGKKQNINNEDDHNDGYNHKKRHNTLAHAHAHAHGGTVGWRRFGYTEEEEEETASRSGEEEKKLLKWEDILTEEIIWTQVVHTLVDQQAYMVYNDVFMTLLENKERTSVEQLDVYCGWSS